jgi:hypothetical protein
MAERSVWTPTVLTYRVVEIYPLWVCGFAATGTIFLYMREKHVGLRIKPAPIHAGINSHPNPHHIGFLPAGTRVKCARCHP